MNCTGNVLADALVKAGVRERSELTVMWGDVSEYRQPFNLPHSFTQVNSLYSGWTDLFNCIRRTARMIDTEWVVGQNAFNTDRTLLTWMRNATSILRVVDWEEVDERSNRILRMAHKEDMVIDVPGNIRDGLSCYISYNVMKAEFELIMDNRFIKAGGNGQEVKSVRKLLDALNYIYANKDKIEFIPILPCYDFVVSHHAFKNRKIQYPEVDVTYLGSAIMRNEIIMDRLADWFAEGNVINPKNEYNILATKEDRAKLYLRRKRDK